jgi:hypothetical protein
MRCVSSRFLTAAPRLSAASPISPARQPAHRQRLLPGRTHLGRHLVVGTTDTARLDLDQRTDVGQRLTHLVHRVASGLLAQPVERAVHDGLGDRLLAIVHDHVDQLGQHCITELGIRQDVALGGYSASRHGLSLWANGWEPPATRDRDS